MKVERRISAGGDRESILEGVRAYFLGEGYAARSSDEGDTGPDLALERRPSVGTRLLSSRIETLPCVLEVRLGPEREDVDERSVWLVWTVSAPWRILTRMDALYFRLESAHLDGYLRTGRRADTLEKLGRLRRPISVAIGVNVVVTAALIALVGTLVGFGVPVVVTLALLVSLVNVVSIVGFADLIVEAMEHIVD
ncbi:MAG: hypothetical protein R3F20_04180 [Planctomycetota bacterium]